MENQKVSEAFKRLNYMLLLWIGINVILCQSDGKDFLDSSKTLNPRVLVIQF